MKLSDIRQKLNAPSPYHAIACTTLFCFFSTLPVAITPSYYRIFACKYYYHLNPSPEAHESFKYGLSTFESHDPGSITPPICLISEVEKLTGTLTAALTTLSMICSVFSISFFSHLVQQWGRKRVLMATTCASILGAASNVAAIWMYGKIGFGCLIFGIILNGLCGDILFMLTISNYLVDTTDLAARATFFALDQGMFTFTAAASSAFGGWASSVTGKLKTPFWISLFGYIFIFFFVLFWVPESLTPERKTAMASLYPENREADDAKSNHTVSKLKALNIVENLKSLLPQTVEDERTGIIRKDYRVFGSAVAFSLTHLVSGFATNLMLLTMTGKLGLDAKRTGWALSYSLIMMGTFLIFIFPIVNKYGRALGEKKTSFVTTTMATSNVTEETPLLQSEGGLSEDVILEDGEPIQHQPKASEFDRVFASGSHVIHAIALLIFGFFLNWIGLLVMLTLFGISAGSLPASKSYMTSLVEFPDKVLSALSMLQCISLGLSPTLFGTLYAVTLDKAPQTPWIVGSAFFMAASIIIMIPRAPRG